MIRGHRNTKRQRTSERSESSSGSSQEAQSRRIRSCTKVFMHGNDFGRGVDLRCVDSYEELFRKLEEIFKIEGQLCGSGKKWNVAYVDDKNEKMMVGDDPWQLSNVSSAALRGRSLSPQARRYRKTQSQLLMPPESGHPLEDLNFAEHFWCC